MNSIIRIQFMASLGATTFENIPTGLGCHSGTKTVLFDGPAVMGLISTLWHDAPDLSKKNQSMGRPQKARHPKAKDFMTRC
jgi:hypothetical protein